MKRVKHKTRLLTASYTVENTEFYSQSVEEMEEEFRDLYDKWCWETGSDEDKKRLDELAETIKNQKAQDKMISEVETYMAEEIRKEIDNEILESLKGFVEKKLEP